MLIRSDDYRTGAFPFPKHEIDPKLKDRKWHTAFAQAIYSSWLRDKTSIPSSILSEYSELRNYGAGKQDPEYYQDLLLEDTKDTTIINNESQREGWMNLNWDIFSVAPKFRNIIIGMMEGQDHDIVANAVDPTSGDEREELKWKAWFNTQNAAELAAINNNLGIKKNQGEGPKTEEEMSLFEELGGFKMKKEYAIERGIDYTFYISDWKEVKRQMVGDFVDINVAANKDYVDRYTQRVRTRYVNPSELVIQNSRYRNHRNSEWAGERIPMQITDIRALMMNEPEEFRMSEDQLRALAQEYSGINQNPQLNNWDTDSQQRSDGSYHYDNFWINVFDGETKSVDIKYKQKRTNKYGTSFYHDDVYGASSENAESDREVKIIKTKTVHRFKWIIGTDHILDWGYQFDIARPGKKEVELSFHVYKLPGRSIMSLIQPNLDALQINWLKLQNAQAQASPAGLAVEFSSLSNMTLGGGKMEPLEILTIRRGQGDLLYRATTHRGVVAGPHSGKPVQELDGGIGRGLDEFIRIFELNLNFIRETTGINQVTDASDPNPNMSVGGSEMAIAATNNALRPMYAGYVTLKEDTSKCIALKLQLLVRHSKEAYNVYYPVLGKSSLEALSIGAEIVDADYHIKIQAKPTAEMKQSIRQAAFESMKADKDGFTGMDYTDYLMVERLLAQGNIKLAQATISYRSKVNKQRQLMIQRENMSLDSENAQKLAVTKGEEAQKLKEAENTFKKDLKTHETDEAIRLENAKHENKMKEMGKQQEMDEMKENKQLAEV